MWRGNLWCGFSFILTKNIITEEYVPKWYWKISLLRKIHEIAVLLWWNWKHVEVRYCVMWGTITESEQKAGENNKDIGQGSWSEGKRFKSGATWIWHRSAACCHTVCNVWGLPDHYVEYLQVQLVRKQDTAWVLASRPSCVFHKLTLIGELQIGLSTTMICSCEERGIVLCLLDRASSW